MNKIRTADQNQCKSKQSYPFFINSARWRKSESYFKENYRLHFGWNDSNEDTSDLDEPNEDVIISVEEADTEENSEKKSLMGLGLRMSVARSSRHSLKLNNKDYTSAGDAGEVVDVVNDTEVVIHKANSGSNLSVMQRVQRLYRSIVHGWGHNDTIKCVDEELGESSFNDPTSTIENLSQVLEIETRNPVPTIETITERNLARINDDDSAPLDPDVETEDGNTVTETMRTINDLCSRWNEIHENTFENHSQRGNKMVEMSEDANHLVYRRGGTGANRLRRVASNESESSISDDSLVAGPPMIDFNEPLPNIPENVVDEAHPNPISTGDVGQTRDLDVTLPHATSNTSRENLQSVVSQLGLDIPIQNKNSCHSPQHLHSPHQSTCCRHAAHNISIESLDLDITGAAAAGGANYCCATPGNNKFGRRLLSRRSCSSIH